jgi:hypothetical protein
MRERWPWQWSMAGLLALLVFGMHASLRFWLPGLFVRLFGEVPDLAQAPPAMIMLLGGYVLLSFISGVLIADRVSEGQLARWRARWAHEEAERRRQWALQEQFRAMERQIREEQLPEQEREWHRQYQERQVEIRREARRRLGLPEEG